MSFNILDQAKNLFSNELVGEIADNFNESNDNITKALSAAVPGILGGLVGRSESTSGAASVLNLVQSAASQFGTTSASGILSNPSLLGTGWEMVKGLFGSQSDNFLSKLVTSSGTKLSTTTGLLGLAAPMIFRMLGNYTSSNNLGAAGLASLLSSNKSSIMQAIPAGLGFDKIFSQFSAPENRSVNEKVVSSQASYQEPKKDGNKWLLPLLLGAALLALLWWFFGRNKTTETEVVAPVVDTMVAVTENQPVFVDPTTLGTYDSVSGNFLYNKGKEVEIKVGDAMMKVSDNSAEYRLFQFLNDANMTVDTVDKSKGWISLNNVYFETGKERLTKESLNQLKNVAAILKAFPGVSLKFGGYTDNTGDAAANLALSDRRAKAAMDIVKNLGANAANLSSEGYGDAHPIADNATAEGRALNRRVDIRVTKK